MADYTVKKIGDGSFIVFNHGKEVLNFEANDYIRYTSIRVSGNKAIVSAMSNIDSVDIIESCFNVIDYRNGEYVIKLPD